MTYIIILVLIIFSALFSGLTLGLMSLNAQELKRKMSLGDKDAKRVYAVRKNGNLLLCTLLIGNVAVNSALADKNRLGARGKPTGRRIFFFGVDPAAQLPRNDPGFSTPSRLEIFQQSPKKVHLTRSHYAMVRAAIFPFG